MTRRRALTIVGLVLVVCGTGVLTVRVWHAMRCAWLRQTCRQARDAGNWDALERSALAWAGLEPRSADPLLFAAEAAVSRRDIDAAASYLQRVPDGDPKAVEALLHRVDMLFGELARPDEAADCCRRILAMEPACGPAHQRLIFFFAVTLQRPLVAAQAREAIAAGGDIPETYVYLIGSDWLTLSNTTLVNQQWLRSHPDDERFLVAAARSDIAIRGLDHSVATADPVATASGTPVQSPADGDAAARDDASARDAVSTEQSSRGGSPHEHQLRRLFERFPTNPELLAFFLQGASTAGDEAEVARLLARVPAASRNDNRFWRFKGWLHAARGQLDEASEALDEALRLNPFDWAARHQRAEVYRKVGRFEDAAREAALAAEGRQIRRAILEQPDVAAVPPATLERMQHVIRACGDPVVATRLAQRIAGRPSE